jgi:DNA-binding transcriptional ArsR family regulator
MSVKLENQIKFKSIVFHALADPIRLEILAFLRDGEKCVCEIVPHLNLIQPVVSRHHVVGGLTPELVTTLTKEVFEQMVCR